MSFFSCLPIPVTSTEQQDYKHLFEIFPDTSCRIISDSPIRWRIPGNQRTCRCCGTISDMNSRHAHRIMPYRPRPAHNRMFFPCPAQHSILNADK